jgi:small-conductance mechanosensitive channel
MQISRSRAVIVIAVTVFALQVADIVSTYAVLATHRGDEANPVMHFTMEHFGAFWWWPKAVIGTFAAGYFATRPSVNYVMTGAAVLCLLVVLSNIATYAAIVGSL